MHNRALSNKVINELDTFIEELAQWLSTLSCHEPREIHKVLKQIAKEGGLQVQEIRLRDDIERIDWREIGGRPARDPEAPGQVERLLEELLGYLREMDNIRAYSYSLTQLSDQLDYDVCVSITSN